MVQAVSFLLKRLLGLVDMPSQKSQSLLIVGLALAVAKFGDFAASRKLLRRLGRADRPLLAISVVIALCPETDYALQSWGILRRLSSSRPGVERGQMGWLSQNRCRCGRCDSAVR